MQPVHFVTLATAAALLDRAPQTIVQWGARGQVRRRRRWGRTDYHAQDLLAMARAEDHAEDTHWHTTVQAELAAAHTRVAQHQDRIAALQQQATWRDQAHAAQLALLHTPPPRVAPPSRRGPLPALPAPPAGELGQIYQQCVQITERIERFARAGTPPPLPRPPGYQAVGPPPQSDDAASADPPTRHRNGGAS